MARKISISINALVAAGLLLAGCMGAIIYLNSLQAALFQEYIDIKHKNNNTEANLVYVRKKLEKCTGETHTTTESGN